MKQSQKLERTFPNARNTARDDLEEVIKACFAYFLT